MKKYVVFIAGMLLLCALLAGCQQAEETDVTPAPGTEEVAPVDGTTPDESAPADTTMTETPAADAIMEEATPVETPMETAPVEPPAEDAAPTTAPAM